VRRAEHGARERLLAVAARALQAIEPALQELERAADLPAQEFGAGHGTARAKLALREQLGRVLGEGADLVTAVVILDGLTEVTAEIHHPAQRAQVGPRPRVRGDDAAERRLPLARDRYPDSPCAALC